MTTSKHEIPAVELNTFVHFQGKDLDKPRISTLGYFDEETEKYAGVELRLDRGVEFLLRFRIVDRSSAAFVAESIQWTDIQDPDKFCDAPLAVRGVEVADKGKTLEMLWKAGDETPFVSMFTVEVEGTGGPEGHARLDPTIINKPPE